MPEIDAAEAIAHDPLDPRPLWEQNPEGWEQWCRDIGPYGCTKCGSDDRDYCYCDERDYP